MPEVTQGNNPNASMHDEVRRARAGAAKEDSDELPRSAVASEEAEEIVSEAAPEEASTETSADESAAVAEPEGEKIRIGDQVFNSTKEAVAYAEQMERERAIEQAHTAGMREAIEAQNRTAAPPVVEPEEDFDAKFYSNPKETLRELRTQARDEAVAVIRAEQSREKMWNDFLTENPDIRRKDAERILTENWETIGKLTDMEKGKKILAQRVRAEYAEIAELIKPRTALSTGKAALSPSGGVKSGVTPQKGVEKILSLSEQLRKMKA